MTRVPFALVGVLLLVGSATFAGSLGSPPVAEPDVDRAMDRTEAATQSAVREAVTSAATTAARNPVTVATSESFGAAIDGDDAFRDALRVRLYVAVRDRLDRLDRHQGDVTVTGSLPATHSGRALADATERVSITRAGADGTALRATIRNVTLTARRDGRTIGERTVSPTVTVPVPTLAVHDRVSAFERRLNADPGTPGLGSRLTGKLYALTWARGLAQFGGAPIENVVANRHLELLTNGAVFSMQHEHFGRADPRSQSVLQWATANTALTDLLSGTDNAVATRLSKARSYAGRDTVSADVLSNDDTATSSIAPEDELTIGINRTADTAFFDFLKELNGTTEQAYETRVQLRHTVVDKTERVVQEPREPGPDWELLDVQRSKEQEVRHRDSSPPHVDRPWHVLEYYPRQVVERTVTERRWKTPAGEQTTTAVREQRGAVDIVLVGRHDGGPAPTRPVDSVHESGGPLGGPNLAGIESVARSRLIGAQSVDGLAVRAVLSVDTKTTATVPGATPDGLYEFVYRDLRDLRERVRDISITVSRGKLATFQVNPGAKLADKLQSRWEALLAPPESYGSIADRARYNARVAYLDTVLDALRNRAASHGTSRQKIADELDERDLPGLGGIRDNYESRGDTATESDLGIDMRVQTAPSYLTRTQLDGSSVPTLPSDVTTTPLVTRNVNFFTVPYGDVAGTISRFLLGPQRVRLSTAVQTLKSAQEMDGETPEAVATDVSSLKSGIEDAADALERQATTVIHSETPADRDESEAVVDSALEPWGTTVGRGEAWTDGSAVDAVHGEADRRYALSEPQSDQLHIVLAQLTDLALGTDTVKPPRKPVNDTTRKIKALAKDRLESKLGDRLSEEAKYRVEQVTGRTLSRIPAGLPLAPPVTPWVTTVNYWDVGVRGEYERFAVGVPRGTPDDPGARFRYVRTDNTVSLDIDEDGTPERLGRSTSISFRTHTSVAIAVPPGPRGVGDVDGTMDERSAGWPRPG